MTKHEVNKLIASYILATGTKGSPSSEVWMLVDPQMRNVFQHIRTVGVLQAAGILVMKNHYITLTEKGLAMHERLEKLATELLAKRQPPVGSPVAPVQSANPSLQ